MVLKRTLSIAKEPVVDDEEEELEKFKVFSLSAVVLILREDVLFKTKIWLV